MSISNPKINTQLEDQFRKLVLNEDVEDKLPSPGNAEVGLSEQEQNRTLNWMNSHLEDINLNPSINPYYMLERLQTRIEMCFGLKMNTQLSYLTSEAKNHLEIPLVPRAAANKVKNFAHEYFVDNGFLKLFPTGLRVVVDMLLVGKLYNIVARIDKYPELNPAPITVQ